MMNKYNMKILLLYLSNDLPEEKMQEISTYLLENPKELEHILNIIKINTSHDNISNRIHFKKSKGVWQHVVSGIVSLIQENQLAFRGAITSYQYKFLDLNLEFVWMDSRICNLVVNSNEKSLYCELLSKDLSFIFQKTLSQPEMVSLEASSSYYLYVPSYSQNSLLEIVL